MTKTQMSEETLYVVMDKLCEYRMKHVISLAAGVSSRPDCDLIARSSEECEERVIACIPCILIALCLALVQNE
jgi:hypothetical protein